MGVPSSSPPPVGTVDVGQLLADAQTKTLWLGVSASVDPAESVLVGDIVGLQEDMDASELAANDYTDSQLGLKSDVGHHHAIGDIDGLDAALDAASAALPQGCIVLWSGILGDIPGGWALCDGQNGTPDLRDRFVMGAGGSTGNALATGGSKNRNVSTAAGGAYTPTGTASAVALTVAQLPAHDHDLLDPGHSHIVTDPGHLHQSAASVRLPSGGNDFNTYFLGGTNQVPTKMANTGITIAGGSTGITLGSRGAGDPHTHPLSLNAVAGHTHTITFDVIPPYVILGYIMRV
jgi:microcystin-dependent protein